MIWLGCHCYQVQQLFYTFIWKFDSDFWLSRKAQMELRWVLLPLTIQEMLLQLQSGPPVVNSVDWTWSRRAHTCLNKDPQIHIRAQTKRRVQGVVLSLWRRVVCRHLSREHSGLHPVEEGGKHQDSWTSLERPGKGFSSNLMELERGPKLPTDGCGGIFKCCNCFQKCVNQVLSKLSNCANLCACQISRFFFFSHFN